MTQEEKNIIIEEAQKLVNFYYETPAEPMFNSTRNSYSDKFMAIQTLYMRLTNRYLVVVKDFDTNAYVVKEETRP